jgi:hypothetical protein
MSSVGPNAARGAKPAARSSAKGMSTAPHRCTRRGDIISVKRLHPIRET